MSSGFLMDRHSMPAARRAARHAAENRREALEPVLFRNGPRTGFPEAPARLPGTSPGPVVRFPGVLRASRAAPPESSGRCRPGPVAGKIMSFKAGNVKGIGSGGLSRPPRDRANQDRRGGSHRGFPQWGHCFLPAFDFCTSSTKPAPTMPVGRANIPIPKTALTAAKNFPQKVTGYTSP